MCVVETSFIVRKERVLLRMLGILKVCPKVIPKVAMGVEESGMLFAIEGSRI